MARASYQHIPNLVLGHLHQSHTSAKTPKRAKRTQGATFTPIKTTYTPTPCVASSDALREKKPILTLKF